MSVIINRIRCLRRGHHLWNHEGRSRPYGQPVRHHTRCAQCGKRAVCISHDHSG